MRYKHRKITEEDLNNIKTEFVPFVDNKLHYLEIGFGRGDFIINSAMNNTNINYIGIEKERNIYIVTNTKAIKAQLPNLQLILADADDIVELLPIKVNKIYLNFSDPWTKRRHHKRRLTSIDRLEKYNNILEKEGIIEIRTDNYDLFTYSITEFSKSNFDIIESGIAKEKEIMSEYEIKFRLEGKEIYTIIGRKK